MTGTTHILSAYLTSPGIRAFTCPRHDQGFALWRVEETRIVLQRYWELARHSGIKYHDTPLYADDRRVETVVGELLADEGLGLDDISEVWGTPGLEKYRKIPLPADRALPVHSLSHLYSGLLLDDTRFRESDIIAVALDGGPDTALEDRRIGDTWYAGAACRSGEPEIQPVESPGTLWLAAERAFQLQPGTLMALASATPATVAFDDGRFLSMSYFGGERLIAGSKALVAELKAAAEAQIGEPQAIAGSFTRTELVASAVMKVIDRVSREIARRGVEKLLADSGFDPARSYLSLTGGYAFNLPTNSYLMAHFGFKGLLAPPCADDSGQALGIGLLGFHARGMIAGRTIELGLPFRGSDRLDLPAARSRWAAQIRTVEEFDADTFVRDIEAGPVAWIDGAGEVGPRALGHRSILADPRDSAAKDRLNEMKGRQWWRPVAPVVLEEEAGAWFVDARRSPYMLENFAVREDRLSQIPAVAHLDGTARVQTLTRDDEPNLHRALSAFFAATGVPILCNTSLNDRGEPIVRSASEAINFCVRKGVRVAYIGTRRFAFTDDAAAAAPDGPEKRQFWDLYRSQDPYPPILYDECPGEDVVFLLFVSPHLHRLLDMPGGEAKLRTAARMLGSQDPTFPERAATFLSYRRAETAANDSAPGAGPVAGT